MNVGHVIKIIDAFSHDICVLFFVTLHGPPDPISTILRTVPVAGAM